MLFGLRCKNASVQLHNTVKWLRQNEEITPIADDYYEAARFRAEARQQGSALQLADCLIAAVAIRLRLVVITGNTKDFEPIRRTGAALIIENWRDAPSIQ